MSIGAAWRRAATTLADTITTDAPGWRQAVTDTPRHGLVPRWWQRVGDAADSEWEMVDHPLGSPERLRAAYTDQALVTQVGTLHADRCAAGERTTGEPTSSSALPGLVVSMVALLDAQPGDRIVDVGTGAGYSAALLAHRYGDEQVTSIDVDPYLVEVARDRLAAFGRTPRLETADATCELPEPEVERILATLPVGSIPASWLAALRPGGRLVTTIADTALVIAADMGPDGVARGRVQPSALPRTGFVPRPRSGSEGLVDTAGTAEGEEVRARIVPILDPATDRQLRTLLELELPGLEIRSVTGEAGARTVCLLGEDGSWARAEDDSDLVHQTGPSRLWDRFEEVARRWDEAGRFALEELEVELGADGGSLRVPGGAWSVGI